jgi:NAD(P)H dehydrogenase (quinone)
VLGLEDEPDWNDGNKRYSEEVHCEMARVERNDAIALVFPVWWWSMPAMLKGWIDRVWNNGWAYGDRDLKGKRAIALGIAGAGRSSYTKREYDRAMEIQIPIGIFQFCGIEDARMHVFYDSFGDRAVTDAIVAEARRLGHEFR